MRAIRSASIASVLSLAVLGAPQTVTEAAAQSVDLERVGFLEWDELGPARGGRSQAVAGSAARPDEYYFGAAGGGLWKTTNAGQSWNPVTDFKINSSSVGAVAVCEADPDVVYMGMGETELRGNIMQGDGIYRSTDGGDTWEHQGLEQTRAISRIRIHPDDCDTAWFAAFGKHSAPNPERGVFKTTDGGENWEKVLFIDDNTGAVDISVHPANPNVIYAATWEAWRKMWGMSSGGPGSGIYKSTDGGESWTDISRNEGLPQEGLLGKIGIAVSPADLDRVYAIIEHEELGGVYRSDDGGDSWTQTNSQRNLRQRAFYYTRIYADPIEPDWVYVLNTGMYRSTDAGESFGGGFNPPHGDQHDLWIAPDDNERMINANDGGGNVSEDGGRSWTEQDYATAQFYRVTTTAHFPYHVCGAQQDNSTACVPSRGWNHLSNQTGDSGWLYSVGGCESGHIAADPNNENLFFSGCYGGALSRYDHSIGRSWSVNVWPENPMGQSAEDLVERVQWNFPIVFSATQPGVLYTGSQKVWRTWNDGWTWEAISPDLTRADPMTIGPSGGPITKDQTGVETYATIFAIAPSPHDSDVIWAGSDDGYVQVTQDGGDTWTNVTPPDAPDFVRINTIEASPHTPGKAYVAANRYLVEDDWSPYAWRTEDFGATWTKIVDGIPSNDFVRAVREDPEVPGLLFAATEHRVHVSTDDGAIWIALDNGLPITQVSDLTVREDDIVISTHGRSFWTMTGIGPLRELAQGMASGDMQLYTPAPTILGLDNSVRIQYWLEEDADDLSLEIIAPSGEVIATYEGQGGGAAVGGGGRGGRGGGGGRGGRGGGGGRGVNATAGAHSFNWNMQYESWTDFPGRIFWAAGPTGPQVAPGTYQVRLTADGQSQTREFEIQTDPRVTFVTAADLVARTELALQIRDRTTQANEAVIQIRDIREQIEARLEETDEDAIEELAATADERMSAVEQEIYQVRNESNQDPLNFPIKLNNKLAALLGQVNGTYGRPTDQSYQVFEYLSGLLQVELDGLQAVIADELTRLNELLREEGLDPIELNRIIA